MLKLYFVCTFTRQKCTFICGNAHDHREGFMTIYNKKGIAEDKYKLLKFVQNL